MTETPAASSNLCDKLHFPIRLSELSELSRLPQTKKISSQIISEYSRSLTSFSDRSDDSIDEILKQLVCLFAKRGKKLSQLIAKLWLSEKEEYPKYREYREYREKFLSGNQAEIKKLLIKEGILKEFDANWFEKIEVKTHFEQTPYEGALDMREIRETEPIKFILIIPYPVPQPEIAVEELEKWINNQDEGQLLPSNPFIPLSTT